jgi:N-acetyl-gamma-glutamylphosphate reductase
VDGLTGSSGAGKKPAPLQHFSHLNDNVVPYRVLNHQHVVEAEMTLGRIGQSTGATVDFIPHLLGTTRGILNTMHRTSSRPSARGAAGALPRVLRRAPVRARPRLVRPR